MVEPVVALVSDLIFSTKIASTGAAVGRTVRIVRSLDDFHAAVEREGVRLAIIDMNVAGLDPVAAIRVAKESPHAPRIIAYLSHVQFELAESAKQNGVSEVMPRSEFSARLPAILESLPGAD